MIKITIKFLFFFTLILLFCKIFGFNIDTINPILRFGPKNTLFGYSIAQHFLNDNPILIVGAPKGESGQPGTNGAGAVFSCAYYFQQFQRLTDENCTQIQIEYPSKLEFEKFPHKLNSKVLHSEGKNNQLLGFVVKSSGTKRGNAMVCAPLLRYGQNAYTDGTCYLLNSNLNHTGVISSCNSLPKKDRHNDYGACEQGFSGYIDENIILTGLPGARKWTGGVFGRYQFSSNGFPDTVDRWTMEVNKHQNGIINILTSHDYLGYSVTYGKFGFWYEERDGSNFTIVSGATRYQQFGAVLFLPFRKYSHPEEERLLGLNDNFTLIGQQLGSGFGSALEVLDLNNDGFDDLLVSAPYEFFYEEDIEFGGAVYIYYSSGKIQNRYQNHQTFLKPIILRGKGAHSQFGISLTKIGNINNDAHGYQDFAVGAPQAHNGQGSVFIYHGNQHDFFVTKPAQEINANSLLNFTSKILYQKNLSSKLKTPIQIKNFGVSLAGGVDMDGNNYNDLAVGAVGSDLVFLFRTRPVIDITLRHEFDQKHIKIDNRRLSTCPSNARTCFTISTKIFTSNRNNTSKLLNFQKNPFLCNLEIILYTKNVLSRALFIENNKTLLSWSCGQYSNKKFNQKLHSIYVPQNNQDWMHPLSFKFFVIMKARQTEELLPIINKINSEHFFEISFDKNCGDDNDCHTDLALSAILLNITRRVDGKYVTKVTERDMIVIRFVIENKKERAFLAKLFIEYDQNELDEPQKLQHKFPIDIEHKKDGLAIVALGNPLEESKKITFDLNFNLVRGSLERVSAFLKFKAFVNSTSTEYNILDNSWVAEVQLIKEADLQLNGASRPSIIRFSNGNPSPVDEEDIGQEVIHAYTLTNRGPFYAKNVTVTIHWPLRLNSKRGLDDFALYILEEPVIRHNGELKLCKLQNSESKGINPLNIYNDETLRLTYKSKFKQTRKQRSIFFNSTTNFHETDNDFNLFDFFFRKNKAVEANNKKKKIVSVFDENFIKLKKIKESSGSWIRVVDVNCKDETAICVSLACHFDYVGTNDAALIEIRSRLWNFTFSEDYKSVEYFAITSDGFAEVDSAQGIIENINNNFAQVTTHAYPNRPLQDDRLDFWIILMAIIVGLLLLSILIIICWRCGFFARKRTHDQLLHRANRINELEQWSY